MYVLKAPLRVRGADVIRNDDPEKSLDRFVVDYMLRTGRTETAKALAQKQGLDVSLSSMLYLPKTCIDTDEVVKGIGGYQAVFRASSDRRSLDEQTICSGGFGMVWRE